MWSDEFLRHLFKDRFKVNVNRGGRERKRSGWSGSILLDQLPKVNE
jgi:hypothetical protein